MVTQVMPGALHLLAQPGRSCALFISLGNLEFPGGSEQAAVVGCRQTQGSCCSLGPLLTASADSWASSWAGNRVPDGKPSSKHIGDALELINTLYLSPPPQGLLKCHSFYTALPSNRIHRKIFFFSFHFVALIRSPSHGPVAVGIRQAE